jgi:drug/metabolite transporter (DMT)-like permease
MEKPVRAGVMNTERSRLLAAFVLWLFCWPSAFPAITVAVREFSPEQITAFRLTGAALLLAAIGIYKKIRLPAKNDIPALAAAGIIGLTVYNLGLAYGLRITTNGAAAFIVGLSPVFLVLFSALFLHERIGWKTTSGIAVSFSGASLIAFTKDGGISLEWGSLLVLISAISAAIMALLQKPLLKRYTGFEVTTYMTISGALAAVPFGFNVFAEVTNEWNEAVFALLFLTITVSIFGYLFWSYMLARLPASRSASLLYLLPLSTMIIAYFWIGEVPGVTTLVGGAIVLTGVAIVNFRRARKARKA